MKATIGFYYSALLLLCSLAAAQQLEVEEKDGQQTTMYSKIFDEWLAVGANFWHGFVASLSVIIVSEIGDKTFFISAILAMKHSRFIVLLGAMAAMVLMTFLSSMMGFATTFIPRTYTFYASTFLFVFFGVKLLKEGLAMSPEEEREELEEVTMVLKQKEEEMEKSRAPPADIEGGSIEPDSRKNRWLRDIHSGVMAQAFLMNFLAEWGDRSQIATIALAARENVWGVMFGGVLGHLICNTIAVLGGRLLAQKISVRTVTVIGGCVFLFFALTSLYYGPDLDPVEIGNRLI